MKGRNLLASAAALAVFFMLAWPRPGNAALIGLKFYGGYISMNGGDMNEGLRGAVGIYKALAPFMGVTATGDYNPFHGGLDIGGDLIINFSPVVGIGFGGGFLQAKSSSVVHLSSPMGSGTWTLTPKATVMPLRAGLYFTIPAGPVVNVSLNGGMEYYLANFQRTIDNEPEGAWEKYELDVDSKGKFGFFGGAGIEIKLHKMFSIILEGRGRYGRIDGFEGKSEYSSSFSPSTTGQVALWYMKATLPIIGQFPVLVISDTSPSPGPSFQDIRSARLDLAGFSALAGLMLRF